MLNTKDAAGEPRPLKVRPRRFCQLAGIGLTSFYKYTREGRIRIEKLGRMTLVDVAQIDTLGKDEGAR